MSRTGSLRADESLTISITKSGVPMISMNSSVRCFRLLSLTRPASEVAHAMNKKSGSVLTRASTLLNSDRSL